MSEGGDQGRDVGGGELRGRGHPRFGCFGTLTSLAVSERRLGQANAQPRTLNGRGVGSGHHLRMRVRTWFMHKADFNLIAVDFRQSAVRLHDPLISKISYEY